MHTDRHKPEARADRSCDTLYGRLVEVDRRRTVYNVFTGISADAGHGVMKGLSHALPVQRAEHTFPRTYPHLQRS